LKVVADTQPTAKEASGSSSKTKEIFLPDIDESDSPKVMDIDTGEPINIPIYNNNPNFKEQFDTLVKGKSILAYDYASNIGALILNPFAKSKNIDQAKPQIYKLTEPLPYSRTLSTSKGNYRIVVLQANKEGCKLEYSPVKDTSGVQFRSVRDKPISFDQLDKIRERKAISDSQFIDQLDKKGATDKTTRINLDGTSTNDADLEKLTKFPNLQELDLSSTHISDAGLAQLKNITSLRKLKIRGPITDVGLANLQGCNTLEDLELWSGKVTDAGLLHLKELPNLHSLLLCGAPVTDFGLSNLKDWSSLQKLYLYGARVTDTGLVHLKDLSNLRALGFPQSQINGSGFVYLKNNQKIKHLWLTNSQLNDVGLAHLKGMTTLETLYLGGVPVTDAGLVHLKELTKLKMVNLAGTQVTEEGVADLKRSLPKLDVPSHQWAGAKTWQNPKMKTPKIPQVLQVPKKKIRPRLRQETTVADAPRNTTVQTATTPAPSLNPEKLLEQLRTEDNAFVDDFELIIDETSQPWGMRWAGPIKRRIHYTAIGDSWGLNIKLIDPGIPAYTKNAEPIDYDLQGNLILWRHSLFRLICEPGFQAKRTDLELYRIKQDGKVSSLPGRPRAELISLHKSEPYPLRNAGMPKDVIYPLWAAGRGLSPFIYEIVKIERLDNGLFRFQATGQYRRAGRWDVTIDPNADYMMRTARFTSDDGKLKEPFIENTGLRSVGSGFLPETARVNYFTQFTYKFVDWRPKHNAKMLTDLRQVLRDTIREHRGLPVSENTESVDLSQNKIITDADLVHLKKLGRLRKLNLSMTKVTDGGLANLQELTTLEELYLYEANITDAGVANLKDLINLRVLNLGRTKITDEGMAYLADLKKLQTLHIDHTPVTAMGLTYLRGLTNLRTLELGCPLSEVGLANLEGLANLASLTIYDYDGKVTDTWLVHLKDLTNLYSLTIIPRPNITDAGLVHLKGMTNLRLLNLGKAPVTDQGIADLKQALPNLQDSPHR
jgi:Leucine-rich repeat (LRR) protein